MNSYFFGLDVGTQGARAVLVDQLGNIVGSESVKFDLRGNFREEQSPAIWWRDCEAIITHILARLPQDVDRKAIRAISVTSTSGTVIPLDRNNLPLHDAIMYSDDRSVKQGERCMQAAKNFVQHGYTGFNSSSGISKMLWYVEHYPEKVKDIALWIHASDYIVGRLSGQYHITDYTNVLKSGYDLNALEWPAYIFDVLGMKPEWLQQVVPSGTVIGTLNEDLARAWQLPRIDVVVGMTDGCATQMASGAVNPGEWNTTIGTTLVIKGVTRSQVVDPLGRLYSHRHPEGFWMPGGASNTGADWISLDFPTDFEKLNEEVATLIPTGLLAWPLKHKGERYPIMAPQARGFEPGSVSRERLFAANLEGVAFIERLAYEIIEELSGEQVTAVFTAGGGSNSKVWLRIRSAVLQVPIFKCKEATGALGAAIMAASYSYYGSLEEAASKMTQKEIQVFPDMDLAASYEGQYQQFKTKLKQLGYI
ncbi:FGGY-family carbohydrate kinase [Sphingobacterium thalpophilum]|uniref:FGGY-family carbohydrate kinase n=1 Tax=Sphingobacterium thalpophilum TaxID=259 RepID=A0ABV4HGW8_9SPHI|nr:FGGY-family carbohydrate kinase [Sphingobacterium thalpophilum]